VNAEAHGSTGCVVSAGSRRGITPARPEKPVVASGEFGQLAPQGALMTVTGIGMAIARGFDWLELITEVVLAAVASPSPRACTARRG
jgi:hypothetical protein